MGKKLFDYVIGNPPYQEETESDSTRKPPVYNLFMDGAYGLANSVELITPARFLFNAGYTPKEWNEKMLNDELEKPEAEVDCEIIDMCIELLAEIDHIKLPDELDIPPVPPFIQLV